MKIRRVYKKVIAMTMVALMLPWSSFVYGTNVEAASKEKGDILEEDYKLQNSILNDEEASPNDASSVQKRSLSSSQEENIEYDSLIVNSSLTLSEDMEVSDVEIDESRSLNLNGHRLTVYGDFKMNKNSNISFNNGAIFITGSLNAYPDNGFVTINMKDAADYLYVEKDFNLKNGIDNISNGTIEAKGDIKLCNLFNAYKNNTFIFSGYNMQTLTMTGGTFNKVVLSNTSEEGILVKDSFNYQSLTNNGCKITIENNEGIFGYTLEEDEEYDELLMLGAGTLDLNGHTLTVNSDFIHSGGTVKLSGGSLIINGNYRIQKRTVEEDEVVYGRAKSTLIMNNPEDLVQIQGDLIVENSTSNYTSVSNGSIVVSGNIQYLTGKNTYGLSTSADNKLILSSEYPQVIDAKNGGVHNIYLENTSEEGVSFVDTVGVSGVFDQGESVFSGNIKVAGDTNFIQGTYTGDLTVSNKSTISGNLNLIGNLTVNSELTISDSLSVSGNIYQNNKINAYGDLSVSGDIISESALNNIYCSDSNITIGGNAENVVFDMSYADAYVLVNGNYTSTYGYTNTPMSNGTLEVKGDINCSTFKAGGDHRLLLSGDSLQTISNSEKMTLATLELDNHSEDGVFFEKIVNKSQLIRNGCRLRYGDLEGEFGWTLEEDEIYNGDLVIIDDTLDLNGHTLTVNGDLIQMSGNLLVNGGTLTVNGDYRMQTRSLDEDNSEEYVYNTSSSSLTMKNQNDIVDINGDFYIYTTADNSQSILSGAINLSGNLYKPYNSSFSLKSEAKLVLDGNDEQIIDTYNNSLSVSVLDISNANTIKSSNFYVTGKLISDKDVKTEDTIISLSEFAKLEGNGINGSLKTYFLRIESDFEVGGDLTASLSANIKGKLTVNGDLYVGGQIYLYDELDLKGKLMPASSYSTSKVNLYLYENANWNVAGEINSRVLITPSFYGDNAEMHVKDFTFNNGSYTKGTIYVSGDFISSNFKATGTNKVILNGDSLQTIDIGSSSRFATLELDNHSDEGVLSKTFFEKDELILNGCKFRYEGIDGIVGYKLTQDETIEGDLVILEGDMDLNGHTLTVTGDVIQIAGDMKINGGKLVVGGDYRQQTRQEIDGEYIYSTGKSSLTMKNSRDTVEIAGSFISNTNQNNSKKIINGRMTVGGDFNVTNSSFIPADSFVLEFSSGKTHNISASNNTKIPVLYVADGSKTILKGGSLSVTKTVDIGNTLSNTDITLTSGTNLIGDIFSGNLTINNSSFTNNLIVNGNLTLYTNVSGNITVNGNVSGSPTVSGNVVVNGNASFSSVTMSGGSLDVSGDYKSSSITMKNSGDLIKVGGSFKHTNGSCRITNGTIEIGGDVLFESTGFNASGENKVILTGDSKQVLSCDNGSFATLELQNYSSDGIYSENMLLYQNLIKNGCKLTYGFGEAMSGFTLEGDYVHSGDFYLIDDVLDLNGHTLTIDGNLIHSGGTIKINNGKLIVKGDLREQKTNGESFAEGLGILDMSDKNDEVTIYGDLYLDSSKTEKMIGGSIRLYGDLLRTINASKLSFGTNIILVGAEQQSVNSNIQGLASLEINNESGVSFGYNKFEVSKHLSKTYDGPLQMIYVSDLNAVGSYYKGNIYLNGPCSFEKDIQIDGIFICANLLDLNDHSLITNDMTIIYSGYLKMDSSSDYISVQNNLVIDGMGSSSAESILTDGTIEVNGNLICNRDYYFEAEGNHKVIITPARSAISSSYRQTISFSDNANRTSKLSTLILRGKEGAFNIANDPESVADEIIYEYPEAEDMVPVTNLSATEISETKITIAFEDPNVSPKASCYEVYRNGVKAGVTSTLSFKDTGLTPNTIYRYTVYAVDKYWNLTDPSEELEVNTASDVTPPTVPGSLEISARTGNSITISWDASKDNIDTPTYTVYRNGETVATGVTDTEYIDTDVKKDEIYTYKVTAVDKSGNESETSEDVTTTTSIPIINRVEPDDMERIGGDSVELKVFYKNYGRDSINTVDIEVMQDGEWTKINSSPLGQITYNSSEYYSKYTWNIESYASDVAVIRYILTDSSGAQDIYETEYEIDHTAPDDVEDLRAEDNNGVIELSWKISGESDLSCYKVYRCIEGASENEVYSRVATIDDRYNVTYSDNTLTSGQTARYIVTAVDDLGNESKLVNPVTIISGEDNSAPEVTDMEPVNGKLSGEAKITAYATDNIALDSILFYIKGEEDSDWRDLGVCTDLKESNGIYTGSISFDTTLFSDGTYYVGAVAVDTSGNINEDDYFLRYVIDNTGTDKILINNTKVGSTYVQLMWDDVSDDDFSYFLVEKKSSDGSYNEIAKERSLTGCTIKGLAPETEYTFRVCGVDDAGNKGEYSEEVTVTTSSDTTKPIITALYPQQGRIRDYLNLQITASDNDSLSLISWSISFDGDQFTELHTEETASQSGSYYYILDISDTEQYPEGDIYIKSEVYDQAGNKNAFSADGSEMVMKYTIDRTAPAAVSNVYAKAYDGYIELNWDEGTEEDIVSYMVYRADTDNGVYGLQDEGAFLNYYDADMEPGKSYEYYVIAVDEAGNRSDKSNISIATASPDETAPRIAGVSPSDTQIGAETTFSIIALDNSKLDKIRTYYRASDTDNWIKIDETEVSARTEWIEFTYDFSNEGEGELQFKTNCIDASGNVSADYLYKNDLDKTPPKGELTVVNSNFEIYLGITHDLSETDVSYYEIYKSELSKSGNNTAFFKNAKSIQKISAKTDEVIDELDKLGVWYVDTDVKPHTAYRYAVKVYDSVGNYSWTNISNGICGDIDTVAPTIVVPEKITVVQGMEAKLDAGECYDNVRIKSIKWDMGNGDTVYGSRPKYKYSKTGKYKAKLIITDTSNNVSEAEIEIQVKEQSNTGVCNLTVVDYNGVPIPYAYVYVNSGSDSNKSYMTDAEGKVSLCYKAGKYKIATFKDGYLPEESEYTITNMKTTEEILALSSGEVVVGDFEVHRMTIQEIVDAGVDLSSPANLNTYTFKTTLTFQKTPIPIVVEELEGGIDQSQNEGTSGGFGTPNFEIGWGGKEEKKATGNAKLINASEDVMNVEPVPVLAVMTTTQSISWLKSMYSATLTITNMADSKYVLEDSTGTIKLPDGVSLAVMDASKTGSKYQSLSIDMGDISGQTSQSVSWTLKGDKTGRYDIDATFSSVLTPFNVPVTKTFRANTDIEVDNSDIEIKVMPESAFYLGEDYYVHFSITNRGEDLYNFTTSIGDYRVPNEREVVYIMDPDTEEITSTEETGGGLKYKLGISDQLYQMPVLSGSDSVTIPTLKSGDTIYGTWKYMEGDYTGDGFSGDFQKEYFKLIDSMVEVIEGENLGVSVEVTPISSHVSKIIKTYYQEEDINISTGDPVDMTSGAFTDSINMLSLSGKDNLDYILSYDSVTAAESLNNYDYNEQNNPLGTGWVGSFSSYIKEENGLIKYYSNPYAYSAFISEDSYNGKLYGEKTSDGSFSLGDADSSSDITFVSATHGMEGYKLTRHSDGTYELTSPAGEVLSYDTEGRLSEIKTEDGSKSSVSYTEHQQIITEEISGNRIVITSNDDGKIISISDGGDKVTRITYSGDDIVSITDAIGRVTYFEYDDSHRIISEINNAGTKFIQNEYDDAGRIVAQTDSLGKEMAFNYSETESGGLKFTATTTAEGLEPLTKEVTTDARGRVVSVLNESGSKESYSYDKDGNIESTVDGYGNTTTFTHDSEGRLTKSNGISGQNYTVDYDDKGNVSSITSDGDTAIYRYDDSNKLIYSKVFGAETNYTYNAENLLIKEERVGKGVKNYNYENGVLVSSTDELGKVTGYKFDNAGNLIELTSSDGSKFTYTYNAVNQKISETDAKGNTTYYTYNDLNLLSAMTDALGNKTSYEYDSLGNLTKEVRADGSVIEYKNDVMGNPVEVIYPDGVTYKYEYDSCGNNTKIIYPDGTTEEFTYDSNGNVTSAKDQKGNVTTYSQNNAVEKLGSVTDSYGNSISYTFDAQGRTKSVSMSQGLIDTYTFDSRGNVKTYTDTLGNVTKYDYNQWGELLSLEDANGNETKFTYDAAGNCVEKKTPEGLDIFYTNDDCYNITSVKTKVQGKDVEEKYSYDAMGNVLTYTDAMGRVTTYTYDVLNRPVTEKTPDGITTSLEYDTLGNIVKEIKSDGSSVTAEYDSAGRVISITQKGSIDKEKSKIYSYSYDSMDRLTSSVDPMQGETSQAYDELGNVTSVTDAMGGTTTYTYDKTSRLLSETNAIGATKKYTYDDKGNLATEENARGDKTTYEYDDFNRLIKISDKAGTVVYTYDNNSNITSISDESGTITKEYDLLNRVTSVTDANGRTVKYSYDELGNILSLTYPGGEIVRYEYYLDGQLKSVIDSSGNKTSYEYDSAGRLIKTTNPDGSTVEESYDKSGNLKTKIDKSSSGEVILSYEYGYDGFGNITSIKDKITTDTEIYSAEPNDGPEENSVSMEYDAANRLISFNGEEVKYDKDGNMIYGPLDGEMVEFEYDCRNRLTKAGNVTYSYDAENLRIAAHYEDYTEEYVLDRVASPNRTLQIVRTDKSETNKKKTNYYYGIGMIYERSDIDTLIYHYDHLGSTRKITDKTGKLRYAFKYDTYGELLSIWDGDESEFYEGSVSDRIEDINRSRPIRFLYNGALGVITDNNNLYYMRQRYYNPAIKRFINQDVLIGHITNSQSLNRYAYVQGNPVSFTDPFGLNPIEIIKSYSGVLHDVLNVASIVPGPVGAVTGMINAGLYGLEGNYSAAAKCAVQAGLTAFVGPLAGAAVGGLCKLSKTARVITSIAAIGAGMYTVGTSAYDLYDNSMDLVDAITSEKGASASEIFHYFSNMIVSTAGIAYGVNGIAGGIGGLTNQCFVAGTKVKTEDGDKNIEEIEVGDKVYSCKPETGETGLKEVKQTFVNETDTIVHLEISNKDKIDVVQIDTTEKHPFYVVDYGFKYASELQIGDKVQSQSGDIYEISDTSIEYLAEPIKVYNFEVEDWHTYYVTSDGILVHNMCKTSPNASDNSSDKTSDTVKAQETTAVATAETPVSKGGSGSINDLTPNQGYSSFKDLKKNIGSAGDGNDWHHIVEQSQINKSGFSPEQIHNTNNIIAVDHATHMRITGYYNTKSFDFTNGLSVRDWLAGQSYEEQYSFGLDILKRFGVIE